MRHTFTTFWSNGNRRDVTTRSVDIPEGAFGSGGWVIIEDNLYTDRKAILCHNRDEFDDVCEQLAKNDQWKGSEQREAEREALKRKQWNPLVEEDGFHVKAEELTSIPEVLLAAAPPNAALKEAAEQYKKVVCDAAHDIFVALFPTNKADSLTLGQLKMDKDYINPSHYQGYVMELQWLETMQYLPHYRDPKAFQAAVELQVRKYMDRSGGKDDETQEAEKALWYHKFLVAYMKNGGPVRVCDIDAILSGLKICYENVK